MAMCATDEEKKVKETLYERFRKNGNFTEDDKKELAPTGSKSIHYSLSRIQNPTEMCEKIYSLIKELTHMVRSCIDDKPSQEELILYSNESLELMLRRWAKLEKDFKTKTGLFDITKIPDIYDCIKYDLLHNEKFITPLGFKGMWELYLNAQVLADVIIPQEYGITKEEKLGIGTSICTPLLRKVRADLQRTNFEEETTFRLNPKYSKGVLSPARHVRTRLYFTSESHIHSLLSCLRYGGLCNEETDAQWARAMSYIGEVKELNYMTQIVLMLYEDPTKEPMSEERFRVELHFSSGAKGCNATDMPTVGGYRSAKGDTSPTEQLSENDDEVDSAYDDPTVTCDEPMFSVTGNDSTPTSSMVGLDSGPEDQPDSALRMPFVKLPEPHHMLKVGLGLRDGSRPSSGPALTPSRASFNTLNDISEHESLATEAKVSASSSRGGLLGVHSAPTLHGMEGTNPNDANWVVSQEDLLRRASHFSAQGVPLDHQMQVPSILPLETLHNHLSLKQIDTFLESFTQNGARTPETFTPRQSFKLNTFTPRRVLPTPLSFGRESDGSLYSRSTSNPSSNTSSALPSPTESNSTNFDFSAFVDKVKRENRKSSFDMANSLDSVTGSLCQDGYAAEDESRASTPRKPRGGSETGSLDQVEPMDTQDSDTAKLGRNGKGQFGSLTVDIECGREVADQEMQDIQTPTNL